MKKCQINWEKKHLNVDRSITDMSTWLRTTTKTSQLFIDYKHIILWNLRCLLRQSVRYYSQRKRKDKDPNKKTFSLLLLLLLSHRCFCRISPISLSNTYKLSLSLSLFPSQRSQKKENEGETYRDRLNFRILSHLWSERRFLSVFLMHSLWFCQFFSHYFLLCPRKVISSRRNTADIRLCLILDRIWCKHLKLL